jgi:cell division protein FtsZ
MSIEIKVVGVGGCGCNIVSHLWEKYGSSIVTIGVNTDRAHLESVTKCSIPIPIGSTGWGAGKNPKIAEEACEQSLPEILDAVGTPDLCIVTCGLGQGTGSGATPIILRGLRERKVLNLPLVTLPFNPEGTETREIARRKLREVWNYADFLLVQSNEVLWQSVKRLNPKLAWRESMQIMDDRLVEIINALNRMVTEVGKIRIDFQDFKNFVEQARGLGFLGIGRGETLSGALDESYRSQMLDVDLHGASGVLVNVYCSEETPTEQVIGAISSFTNHFGIENFKEGLVVREGLPEVLVIATQVRSPFLAKFIGEARYVRKI